jgi:hypothetical protein
MCLAFLFSLLVFKLAEIEHTANGRLCGRGYFHQVCISFSGELESISHYHYTELLAVLPDDPDLFTLDSLVNSIFSGYTCYLPGISFYLL